MNKKIAKRKIELFTKRFGLAHLYLAYHAAFPLTLTPDLLYSLWSSFRQNTHKKNLYIPWIAVSDILLSNMCQEVEPELYELDRDVRLELIRQMQDDPQFGEPRIKLLSDFILEYIQIQLRNNLIDSDLYDLLQTQKWVALAYTKPVEAAKEIALTFQQLGQEGKRFKQYDKTEFIRLASVTENLSDRLMRENLQSLLIYADGVKNWGRGNIEKASEKLDQIIDNGKIKIVGVELFLPEEVEKSSEKCATQNINILDYSNQNLQGRSFVGKNLSGANFSGSDLKSTNFSKAILTGANFTNVHTGMMPRWASLFLLFPIILIFLSSLFATLVGSIVI